MNHAAVAALLAALLAGPPQNPPPVQPDNGGASTERIERGQVLSPAGAVLHYRIRLLPLASFPDLPTEVAAQLQRRQCMVPQTFEAQEPENVVHGAFRAAGSNDWATLCSVAGATTLYVFFSGQYDSPIPLRSQADTAWLGAEPGSTVYSSAWGIALRPAEELRDSLEIRHLIHPDHDGIEDAHLEHVTTVHYFQAGKWLLIDNNAQSANEIFLLAPPRLILDSSVQCIHGTCVSCTRLPHPRVTRVVLSKPGSGRLLEPIPPAVWDIALRQARGMMKHTVTRDSNRRFAAE